MSSAAPTLDEIREAATKAAPSDTASLLRSMPRLPETFYESRAVLDHIRRAAHARNRAPDAVLHCVLARVAAFRPPLAQVDTGIASPASLNYLVALVDASGSGKSSPEKIARRLLPAPHEYRVLDGLPIGSGEGLAEAYMGEAKEPDDDGKMVRVRRQVHHNALFYADEGQVMTRLGARDTSTLGESLRRAFNAETLGQTNASKDRSRRVEDYSLGLVVGMQPRAALGLLAEADYGTPQRFCWTGVTDPTIPDDPPEWPGMLSLDLVRHHEITIEESICDEIRADDTARVRGELTRDPLDAHEPLCRVKLAGLLALLDGRHRVTVEDWSLASVMWEVSCGVRNTVADYGRMVREQERRDTVRLHANMAVAADRAVRRETETVARVARVLWRKVQRDGATTRNDLRRAVASRDRRHLGRALRHALAQHWLDEAPEPDTYTLGHVEP